VRPPAHYWRNREGVSGRGGIGAVLGQQEPQGSGGARRAQDEVADNGALKGADRRDARAAEDRHKALTTFGTPFLVGPINALGGLGAYNLRQETFAEARAVSGEDMKTHYHDRDTTCLKCPVACGKQYAINEGRVRRDPRPRCRVRDDLRARADARISNPEALILANDLCDLLGMTRFSLGVTLAFVAEAVERAGSTSRRSRAVRLGDWRGMLRLVEMTARARLRRADRRRRLAARGVGPSGGDEARLRRESLELPRTRHARSKASRSVTRPRPAAASHHDTRPTPQYAQGFDVGAPRQAGVASAQPALHRGRGLASHLPLHVRAWLRPLRRRAVRHDGRGRSPAGT